MNYGLFVQDENEKMGYRIKYKKFPEKGLDLMSKDNLLKRDYKDFLNLIKEQMLNSMIHLILKLGVRQNLD